MCIHLPNGGEGGGVEAQTAARVSRTNGNFGSHVGRFSDRYKLDCSGVEVDEVKIVDREGRGERLQALSLEA